MKEVKRGQKEFLKILESFMHNKKYCMPEDFQEMQELCQLAGKHKMMAAVYEQIRLSSVFNKKEYEQISLGWKRAAVRDVMFQIQRTEGFFMMYEKLCEAGLRPLVVKGIVCRNLYEKSDYRISADEDILVPKEAFEVCDKIFLQEGFVRENLNPKQLPYEISYIHPQRGVHIELHLSLFPEESGAYGHLNDEFLNVFENCICEEIQGKKIWTLSPTEHFLFLICHSFKHFLHSGFGIRQVCDMVMMAEHYGNCIDWRILQKTLARLNMETYWQALMKMSKEHLGFSCEKAVCPMDMQNDEIDYEPLLYDLLDGGIYGDSTMERKHSSNITLAAAKSGKKDTAASIKNSLFPEFSYMKKQFEWLEKYPWLLWAAYGIRIVRYIKYSPKEEKQEQNSVQIGMERVELLRKYNIIK